jgi:hypothetical protein
MLPRLSCLLTCHNDVTDAGQNNRLFASGTDMDQALLRLSHMHKGTYYVQICDKIINHRDIERYQSGLINNIMSQE